MVSKNIETTIKNLNKDSYKPVSYPQPAIILYLLSEDKNWPSQDTLSSRKNYFYQNIVFYGNMRSAELSYLLQ